MISGAATPIAAYVGAKAIMAMDSVISAMMSCSAALRPLRSAYMPSTMPPTGRMKNPTPKVAMVSSRDAYSFCAGKNSRAMMTVRKP